MDRSLLEYGKYLEDVGVELKNGYGDLFNKLDLLDSKLKENILSDISDISTNLTDLSGEIHSKLNINNNTSGSTHKTIIYQLYGYAVVCFFDNIFNLISSIFFSCANGNFFI